MKCETCGNDITPENKETRGCPECEHGMCDGCDMGVGTVCIECEEEIE